MTAPVEFAVPFLPPTLNVWSRAHWTARARWAKEWRFLVRAHAPRSHAIFRAPVIVTLTFYSKRARDCDSMAKFPLDGLTGVLIADDGPEHVSELRLRSRTGKPERTEIRVEVAE
jgi:Holliday junction resolvase RusA-like endonuclease